MRNMVTLQKDKEGNVICSQITPKGKELVESEKEPNGYWEEGGTIVLKEELDEILDREI